MNLEQLETITARGEGASVEFKRCGGAPGFDVLETICSFANRQGGSIYLGVLDDGTIEGIDGNRAGEVERNLVNSTGNPKLFNSAPALEFERVDIGGGRCVLRVWVPMSPTVHRLKGIVYDRVADVDVKALSDAQVTAMALRKQNFYTERRVISWVSESDLRMDLLPRVREMIGAARADHPWLSLSDSGLLRAARLVGRDPQTGEKGFNLACVLLLGSDDAILDACPAYRTEALLRRSDVDRYDDRESVRTNLIESYDRLVGFCSRWLPDAFVMDRGQRVSARDVIVRELVCNCLIHREFTSPYIAKLEVGREALSTRNASRSLYSGPITPDNLDPTPKNPTVANFFTQIGRSEELGSGTRNLFKYSLLYSGSEPELRDGDFFEARIPLPAVSGESPARRGGGERLALSYLASHGASSSSEVAAALSTAPRTAQRHLSSLVEQGLVERVGAGRSTRYRAL